MSEELDRCANSHNRNLKSFLQQKIEFDNTIQTIHGLKDQVEGYTQRMEVLMTKLVEISFSWNGDSSKPGFKHAQQITTDTLLPKELCQLNCDELMIVAEEFSAHMHREFLDCCGEHVAPDVEIVDETEEKSNDH